MSNITRPRKTGILTKQDLKNTISAEKPSKPTTTSLKCSFMWPWISWGIMSHELSTVPRRLSKVDAEALSWNNVYA